MTEQQIQTAAHCLDAAENDMMTFPEIVGRLIESGFESYQIDLRRGSVTYYHNDGDSVVLPLQEEKAIIGAAFDAAGIQEAIREAQKLVPGYSFRGFRAKIRAAGCVGYVVSFPGKRAVYFGRTAEVHVELFPK